MSSYNANHPDQGRSAHFFEHRSRRVVPPTHQQKAHQPKTLCLPHMNNNVRYLRYLPPINNNVRYLPRINNNHIKNRGASQASITPFASHTSTTTLFLPRIDKNPLQLWLLKQVCPFQAVKASMSISDPNTKYVKEMGWQVWLLANREVFGPTNLKQKQFP